MSEQAKGRRGLGRGLSALMADIGADTPAQGAGSVGPGGLTVTVVPLDLLHPNPNQPRRSFRPEALEELARSIEDRGILQPLIVRPLPGVQGAYQIVAGERRWRAAQSIPLHQVPVIVRDLDDQEVLEIAIIENIQRADLDPIEEAMGYRQLIDTFGHTQEKLAAALGKSRSYITNAMRLLTLPGDVQALLAEGALSVGHARALITAGDASSAMAQRIVAQGLSVRATEAMVRESQSSKSAAEPKPAKPGKDADTKVLEGDLTAALDMQVLIDHRADGSGKLSIRYDSLEELDQLCQLLSGR